MRLICPNCGAQYEVGPDAVPLVGRDVQCSNCGHTWFEAHGASQNAEAELDTDLNVTDQQPVLDEPEVDESAPALADTAPDDMDEPSAPKPARQEIDPAVSEILKEEANREKAARQKDAPLETQGDLGIQAAATPVTPNRPSPSDSRISKLRGEQTAKADAAASTRKEMLPDIEEINSTLRTSEERGESIAPAPDEIVKSNRRGFRTGFMSMLALIVLLILLYVLATPISNLVPALKGPLDSYVTLVDGFRAWLNNKMSGVVANLESNSSSAN